MIRPTARLITLYLLEGIAALLALGLFAGGVILWRLASGPVSIDAISPSASQALARALGGERADVSALSISYDPNYAALVINGQDVRVYDDNEQILAAAQEVEAGLALDLLLIGRAVPVRLTVEGGSFSFVRRSEGEVEGQFLTPDAMTGDQAQALNTAFAWFIDQRETGFLSRLIRVDLRNTDIRLEDEGLNLLLLMQEANSRIQLNDQSIRGETSGNLINGTNVTPISIDLVSDQGLDQFFLDVRVRNFIPFDLLSGFELLGPVGTVQAPVDMDLVIDTSRESGLRSVLVDIDLEEGTYRFANEEHAIQGGDVSISYDTAQALVEIQSVRFDADNIQLNLSGEISDLTNFNGAWPQEGAYSLQSDNGLLGFGGAFPSPIAWTSVNAEGRFDLSAATVFFDDLDVQIPQARGDFSGQISIENIDGRLLPSTQITGPISGTVTKDTVLAFWPVNFALGARDWIEERLLAGLMSNAELDLNIPAEAIANRMLENEHLMLAFDFNDADVQYISTMPPLTGLTGRGVLYGNAFELNGTEGQIGDLQAETIFVNIPRLNPKGAIARFGGTGYGDASDLMSLINYPPLSLAEIYGYDPEGFSGEGSITFEIGRAMRRVVPAEDILFSVTADFDSVAGPTGISDIEFQSAAVSLAASEEGLRVDGTGVILGQSASIIWEEVFGLPEGSDRTTISLNMNADARTLDQFGLPVRRFINGMVGLEASLNGNGFDFSRADLDLDLTRSVIALPDDLWVKPLGEPSNASLSVSVGDEGLISLDSFQLQADTARMAGQARLTGDGQLVEAELSSIVIDGLMNLSATYDSPLSQADLTRPSLVVAGSYLNGESFVEQWRDGSDDDSDEIESDDTALAIDLDVQIDRLDLTGVSYSDVFLRYASSPLGIEHMALTTASEAGPLEVSIAAGDQAEPRRAVHAYAADAGAVLEAFAGFDNAQGGSLQFDGHIAPLGESGQMTGDLVVSDFTIERMPLLARLLAAGSLEGIASLLGGGGLEFETFESAIAWNDGRIGMTNARVAGPALGLTWNGEVDLDRELIGLEGTLVPSYGTNTFLGEIPVVGDILTSREGEGIIGITFGISGNFGATRVSANPLSALAPGVFRRIFEGTDVTLPPAVEEDPVDETLNP